MVEINCNVKHVGFENICKLIHRVRQSKSLQERSAIPTILNGLHSAFMDVFPGRSEILDEICEIVEGFSVFKCHAVDLPNLTIDCTRNDLLLVANNPSSRRDTQILFELTSITGKVFQLIFISSDNQLSFRHGSPFYSFGLLKTTVVVLVKILLWNTNTTGLGNI